MQQKGPCSPNCNGRGGGTSATEELSSDPQGPAKEGWGRKSVVCPYNIVSVSSLHATRETEPKWEDSIEALKKLLYAATVSKM